MKVTAKDLECLKLFSICTDNSSEFSNKFKLETLEDKTKIGLIQYTNKVVLFKVLDNKENEKIEFITETNNYYNMVSTCSDLDTINITNNKTTFGIYGKYNFDVQPLSYTGITSNQIYNLIRHKDSMLKFKISNLANLKIIKKYMGINDYEVFGFFNKKFITTDKYHCTGIVDVESDCPESLENYFPAIFYNIVALANLDEVTIYRYDKLNQYMFEVNGVYVFIPIMQIAEHILPNIFVPEIRKMYDHPYQATVNKIEFEAALKRIMIVSSDILDNRVFMQFNDSILKLENKKGNYGYEEIPAVIPKELIGLEVIISVNYIQSMLQYLGEEVIIKADNKKDLCILTLTDKDNNKLFLHNLYRNYE